MLPHYTLPTSAGAVGGVDPRVRFSSRWWCHSKHRRSSHVP